MVNRKVARMHIPTFCTPCSNNLPCSHPEHIGNPSCSALLTRVLLIVIANDSLSFRCPVLNKPLSGTQSEYRNEFERRLIELRLRVMVEFERQSVGGERGV